MSTRNRLGKVRIVAGQWRGRRLDVVADSSVRPTSDRVRETVFNWLADRVVGAACLDLFAGTGALGFEAAARQARSVTMIERDPGLHANLERAVALLDACNVELIQADSLSYLKGPSRAYDSVFVDPPFPEHYQNEVIVLLTRHAWLAANATIYLEMAASDTPPALPPGVAYVRQKTSGNVRYCLARRVEAS